MVNTIKFSQMNAGGDLAPGESTPGLLAGANVLFNNPWTFLAPGSTASRPVPSSDIDGRLRFNTDDLVYEYYDTLSSAWVELSGSGTGTVNPGSVNDLAYYAASGTTVSALPTAANSVLVTNGSSVPSLSTSLPSGLSIPGATITSSTAALSAGSVVAAPVSGTDLVNKTYADGLYSSSVHSITGTINQVIASSPTGNVTLSLPQDIAVGSTPTFVGLNLSSFIQGTTGILDSFGNIILQTVGNNLGVNYMEVNNQVSGDSPGFVSKGADTNVNLGFLTKGTGFFDIRASTTTPIEIKSGTNYQHVTILAFPDTNNTVTATFQDSSGTVAYLSNIPAVTPAALTATPDTNVTITLGGTPSTSLLQATSITLGWTGQLSLSRGGSNASLTASNGGIVYSTASAMAILAGTATANLPLLSGSTAAPTWGSFALSLGGALTTAGGLTLSGAFGTTFTVTNTTSLTLPTSGTLATTSQIPSFPLSLANGGTNANLTASNGGIFYSTASAGAILAGTATSGQHLQSGASGAPSWTTTTYPSTNAINTIMYASSANVLGSISAANSSVLVTSAGGVPSFSTTLPSGISATNMALTTPNIGAATATSINFGGSTLSTYTNAGTFTPAITFGGAAVGLTYSVQTGLYNQIGGVVFFSIVLQINAIGSSTGLALFTGLPVAARVGQTQFVTIATSAVTYLGQIAAGITSGASAITPLYLTNGSGQTQLTNTAFTSGCIVWVSGSYLV